MKYIKSPIMYVGGKYKVLKHIWRFIPDVSEIISPFFGGGAIELNYSHYKNVCVEAYDICPYLIVFWKHFLNSPENVYDRATQIFQDNSYESLREKHSNYVSQNVNDTLESAALFYLFNRVGYRGSGLTFNIRKQQYDKGIKTFWSKDKIEGFNRYKDLIQFECKSFTQSLANTTKFAVCDPPYVSTELYQRGGQ